MMNKTTNPIAIPMTRPINIPKLREESVSEFVFVLSSTIVGG